MLKQRILTALLLIPLVWVALFYFSAFYWMLFTLGVISLAAWEWARLFKASAQGSLIYAGLTCLAMLLIFYLNHPIPLALIMLIVLFWTLAIPIELFRKYFTQNFILAGFIGWLVLIPAWQATLVLRQAPSQAASLLGLMSMVWIADTAAYFSGKRWGRHKLAPQISPGKTWEGVIGGTLAVVLYGLGWFLIAPTSFFSQLLAVLSTYQGSVFSVIMMSTFFAAVSILGDLFESLLKRQAGVKDSSQLLPGHGGVLDRIDSLVAVLGVALLPWYMVLGGR